MLSENGGSATITPGSYEAVTGSNGVATFTATDYSQQSVSFTATDVTDGNPPVPGSAVVTFEPGGSSSSCSDTPPTPVGGYTIGPWASGLAYNPQDLDIDGVDYYACSGIDQPATTRRGTSTFPTGSRDKSTCSARLVGRRAPRTRCRMRPSPQVCSVVWRSEGRFAVCRVADHGQQLLQSRGCPARSHHRRD